MFNKSKLLYWWISTKYVFLMSLTTSLVSDTSLWGLLALCLQRSAFHFPAKWSVGCDQRLVRAADHDMIEMEAFGVEQHILLTVKLTEG